MKLTREKMENLRTEKGGFTIATTKALGIPWPLPRGWLKNCIGRNIPDWAYEEALAGRTVFTKRTLKIREKWDGRGKLREFPDHDEPTLAVLMGERMK